MSSRFSEHYKKKRGKKFRHQEKAISSCQFNSKSSFSNREDQKNNHKELKKKIKSPNKYPTHANVKEVKETRKYCQKNTDFNIKLKDFNVPSTSKGTHSQINTTVTAEKVLQGKNREKRQKKANNLKKEIKQNGVDQKGFFLKKCSSRKQKRKQRKGDMASPNTKYLKKDNVSQRKDNHHSDKINHKQQQNHRKCSTKCSDDHLTDGSGGIAVPPELPGFYYDKEKKKYFKILPDDSCIGNAVTATRIKNKEKEKIRQNDIQQKPNSSRPRDPRKKQCHCFLNSYLPSLTYQYQQGIFTPRELDHRLNILRIKNINKKPQTRIKIYADSRRDWLERLEHASQLEMIENKHIVGLFTIQESMIQRILWLKFTDRQSTSQRDRLSLSIDPSPSCRYYQSAVKIASMCLIDKESVLYTGMVYTGTPESLVFIKGLGEGSSRYEVYSLGQKATWACAWNKHSNQFSVGSEKCGMLLDVQTRRLWQINSNNSDILCQVFSKQNGNYLYSGTRKNQIFTHDLRNISTYAISHLTQSSSVCGLQLLQNDIHLLASDVKGKVNLWDLRMKKVVTRYHGMENEYLRIPIHVDTSEEIVYGVDQVGYTRLWCLQTGELLKTVPPPLPTSYDFFPSVLYSKTWNDRPGNAGLLMGLGDKIYVYSDYQDD